MIHQIRLTPEDQEKTRLLNINPATENTSYVSYVDVFVEKPWGYEYSIFENDSVAVWLLKINKGYQTSMHAHLTKKTSLFVLAGEAICSTLNSEQKIQSGHGLIIDRGVFHSTRAVSPEGAIIIETESPNNKTELVRLYDKYGRTNKQYQDDPQSKTMEKIIGTFHHPESQIDNAIQFGNHYLMVASCKNGDNFRECIQKFGAHAVTLLQGSICTPDRTPEYKLGDLVPSQELLDNQELSIFDNVLLLLIKQVIN